LRHQHRDDYWTHGSVCEDYSAIKCPVFSVSGWADGYSNAVFRLMRNLDVPRKGLIGPWSHKYPHQGVPGPAINFLRELLNWWDHWLKGKDTGVEDEPMLRVWMQDSVPPTTYYSKRPGRWVAENKWPSERIRERAYNLSRYRLVDPELDAEPFRHTVQSPLSVGLFAGKWCSYAAGPDLAHDQRQEDGGSLVFQSERLDEGFEIMGAPCVDLEISTEQEVAMVAVRLSDVAPDDKVTRVTYGLLNLTHRYGSEEPRKLQPGKRYRVRVELNGIAHVFPKGHKVRLSVSTSYWPLAWPPPRPVRLNVHTEGCSLFLPEREPRDSDAELPELGEPEGAPGADIALLEREHHNWLVHRDLALDASELEVIDDRGRHRLEDIDLEVECSAVEKYSSIGDDFDSARAEVVWERSLKRGEWKIRTVTRTVLTASPEEFILYATLDAYEWSSSGEKRVFSNNWDERIPRELV
ncbi:MAG TPA: CocE/NonD family hydrolase, partial [Wenzhouxiangellaceae bacterium]|nr:CocE/NonD family hydrolase [Wenzhouxiangellaceae bacterium]